MENPLVEGTRFVDCSGPRYRALPVLPDCTAVIRDDALLPYEYDPLDGDPEDSHQRRTKITSAAMVTSL